MKTIELIRKHPLYAALLEHLNILEEGRGFCRHGIEHLLDVARIAYIRNLEYSLHFSREMIYAAALLHDIGKSEQYESGTPHEIASARIAAQILEDLSPELPFSPEEQQQILTAIRGHRKLRADAQPLEKLLYESDKASRTCFACPSRSECDWPESRKNKEITI